MVLFRLEAIVSKFLRFSIQSHHGCVLSNETIYKVEDFLMRMRNTDVTFFISTQFTD